MILCCGEALIDMIPAHGADGSPVYHPCPGGSGLNSAVALGRLGTDVGIVTGLSTDPFGRQLEAHLQNSGVSTAFAARCARPTTLSFVSLQDGQAEYLIYDENTAGRMVRPGDLPAPPDNAHALLFGDISLMVEPSANTHEAYITRCAGKFPLVFDPNIRPAYIRDEHIYRARMMRLIALSQIVKLSDEDLTWIMGPGDPVEQAQELLKHGPDLICLTRGVQGVYAIGTFGVITVPAVAASVADTVGAGDSFGGALLHALDLREMLGFESLASPAPADLRAALTYAVRAAAITVSRPGADPPWAWELE